MHTTESTAHVDPAAAHNDLGAGLALLGHLESAAKQFRKALAIQPDLGEAHGNLAGTLVEQGHTPEALGHYAQALQLNPESAVIHSNMLLALHYDVTCSPERMFAEHLRYAQQHTQHLATVSLTRPGRDPERILRIGYVSPDFRTHSVAHFISPILTHHDRQRFQVVCYANVASADQITQRLRSHADCWQDVYGMPDQALAELIRTDEIDILVDLAGHTRGHRLLVFARRPAPVQMTYLGYPNTTGLPTIDYRITDEFVDQSGVADALHTEELIRLPDGFLCYQPADADAASSPPATERGFVTFAFFNSMSKISIPVLDAWASILRAVPNSRLMVKARALRDAASRRYVQAILARHGVDLQRIDLLAQVSSVEEHLALYRQADIALDPFPYSGTTTSCEALWMGLPVVTLAGRTHHSRVTSDLLHRLHLADLSADSVEAYVDCAVNLATDFARLQALRGSLRQRMHDSGLLDGPRFVRSLEAAYRAVWRRWCTGQGPVRRKFAFGESLTVG